MPASIEILLKVRQRSSQLLSVLFIGVIRLYQYAISPLLGPRCRFWPNCSSYAIEAVRLHGPYKGGWLALKRIAKCHPWHPGGIDLVPPKCPCEKHSKTPPETPSPKQDSPD